MNAVVLNAIIRSCSLLAVKLALTTTLSSNFDTFGSSPDCATTPENNNYSNLCSLVLGLFSSPAL